MKKNLESSIRWFHTGTTVLKQSCIHRTLIVTRNREYSTRFKKIYGHDSFAYKVVGISSFLAFAVAASSAECICEDEGKSLKQQTKSAQPSESGGDSKTLECETDLFGGVIIDSEKIPRSPEEFEERLQASLKLWLSQGKRGVWISISSYDSILIPIAVKVGFEFHNANNGKLTLTRWLPNTESTLPPNASHQVGVGICVVDSEDRILVVRERSGLTAARGKNFWKIPTGLLNTNEDIADAACREVLEETGVRVAFEGVAAFRQLHGMSVEKKTDVFFLCKARALSHEIQIQESELAEARWMPVREFLDRPLWPEGSAMWSLDRIAAESILQGRGDGIRGPRLSHVPLFRPTSLPSGFTRPGKPPPPHVFVYSGCPKL